MSKAYIKTGIVKLPDGNPYNVTKIKRVKRNSKEFLAQSKALGDVNRIKKYSTDSEIVD